MNATQNDGARDGLYYALRRLHDGDSAVREDARLAIELNMVAWREAWLESFDHPDRNVRLGAVAAAVEFGHADKDIAVALNQALEDCDQWIRHEACCSLEAFGEIAVDAVPRLVRLIDDDCWHIRMAAIETVSKVKPTDDAVLKGVSSRLTDKQCNVRASAALALGNCRILPNEIEVMLADALQDVEPLVRKSAAVALSRLNVRSEQCAVKLTALLDDPDFDVRIAAFKAISNVGSQTAIVTEKLVWNLAASDALVRDAARATLVQFDERVVKHLVCALSASSSTVRSEVVRVLGEIRVTKPFVVNKIRSKLDDPDCSVRINAATALWQITGELTVAPFQDALGGSDYGTVDLAVERLFLIGRDANRMEHALATIVGSAGHPARLAAAITLAGIKAQSEFTAWSVLALLNDPSSESVEISVRVLGTMRGAAKIAVPSIVSYSRDRENAVRLACARALGRIGNLDDVAFTALQELLADDDKAVARAAEIAIQRAT